MRRHGVWDAVGLESQFVHRRCRIIAVNQLRSDYFRQCLTGVHPDLPNDHPRRLGLPNVRSTRCRPAPHRHHLLRLDCRLLLLLSPKRHFGRVSGKYRRNVQRRFLWNKKVGRNLEKFAASTRPGHSKPRQRRYFVVVFGCSGCFSGELNETDFLNVG